MGILKKHELNRNPQKYSHGFYGVCIILTFFCIWGLFPAKPVLAARDLYTLGPERFQLPGCPILAGAKLELFIDDQDQLYVLNLNVKLLYIFDAQTRLVARYQLDLPSEILDDDASLWIQGDRIYIKPLKSYSIWQFDKQGKFAGKILLQYPNDYSYQFIDFVVDPRGYIYTLESLTSRVEVFNPDGSFYGTFAKTGSMAKMKRANTPWGSLGKLFIDKEGRLYICTTFSSIGQASFSWIFRYSYQGRLEQTLYDNTHHYKNFFVDRLGNVFAVSPRDSTIVKFDRRGQQICQFKTTCGQGVAVDGKGAVFLDTGNGNAISIMYPSETAQLIDAGNEAYLNNNWEQAEKSFRRALTLNNQIKYLHLTLGEVYFQQKQWIKSMREFEYSKDNFRFSQALTGFRNFLVTNYWPFFIIGLLLLGLLCYLTFLLCKKMSNPYLNICKVIWAPQNVLLSETRAMNPVIAWLIILIFPITHYLSRYYTNPIFAGEEQVLSFRIFSSGLFITLILIFIWTLAAYKVGELFQGLARYSYILAGTAICLIPLITGEPLLAFVSHLLTFQEKWIYQWGNYLLISWVTGLFILKIRLTGDFTWGKALGVSLLNLAAVALVIVFLGFLIGVNQQLGNFVADIFKEIFNRITT